ncbi:hypothetical protein KIN20_005828 [Parelaphostrongylus tenuis]|uniref:Uncharacterized protein n=1 Tax=Parelaphostrongylus tenuis TaxID=148309 RepID=A0AAD5QIX0_PARTN|nr:hypothetical protein KIN20_005828 [Parelaphostrongylus tenuis]
MPDDTIEVLVLKRHSMKSTKLKGKAKQTDLLLDAGFNVSQCRRSWAQRQASFRTPTKLSNEDLIAASEDSKSQGMVFDEIRNLADRWQKVVKKSCSSFCSEFMHKLSIF